MTGLSSPEFVHNCEPCNAYIIASEASGIRQLLPRIFPGCTVVDWKPKHKPLRGQVAKAVAYLQDALIARHVSAVTFTELMDYLGIPNRSNFNRTIRQHRGFIASLEDMGLHEVSTDGGRYRDGFARALSFAPLEGASYRVS